MGVERTEGQKGSSPLALRAQKRKGSAETVKLPFFCTDHGEQNQMFSSWESGQQNGRFLVEIPHAAVFFAL
jgi:hypothetical protein